MTTSIDPIRASDKLQSLFDRDDRLIDVIASRSPQLAKLRHSPMRRIMARVTTVSQAARLCNISAELLVRDLNNMLGIEAVADDVPATDDSMATADDSPPMPSFASAVELDVHNELSNGGEPFSRIMAAVAGLAEGQVLHLRAPFEPVPLFGVMQKRGFGHTTEKHGDDDWSVWFFHNDGAVAGSSDHATSAPDRVVAPLPSHRGEKNDDGAVRTEVWLDVRDLEPPEPLVRTLEALEGLPKDNVLIQVNMRVPQFLLPILRERGFHFTIDESQSNEVQVRIWRND